MNEKYLALSYEIKKVFNKQGSGEASRTQTSTPKAQKSRNDEALKPQDILSDYLNLEEFWHWLKVYEVFMNHNGKAF